MKNHISFILIIGFITFACNEEPIGQQPLDHIPPGVVSDVNVENIPGGAILTYKLPQDEDLLYVKAIYSLKDGQISESRSSLYTDTLKVEGFGDTKEQQVKLVAVDRSRNESPEVDVTIAPLEPPVITIGKTLDLVPDFGGVHGYWENSERAKIATIILKKDNNNEYVPLETFYSSMVNGEGTVHGMDTIPADFGIYVQDRWENQSEIKYYTLTPIYETKFDRLKFKSVDLPGDASGDGGGGWWDKSSMWNGVNGDNGYSSPGGTGVWPHSVTFDLGVTGQISRLRIFQRLGSYIFGAGNPRKFEVWGCLTLDPTGNWDSWTKLMDCTSIKPSGLPLGQNTNEDIDRATNGEDFICSPTNPKVRYIRIKVTQSWAGGDNFQISELEVHGDNR